MNEMKKYTAQLKQAMHTKPTQVDKGALWAAIESELPPPKKRDRKVIFWWGLGSGIGAIFIGAILYTAFSVPYSDNQPVLPIPNHQSTALQEDSLLQREINAEAPIVASPSQTFQAENKKTFSTKPSVSIDTRQAHRAAKASPSSPSLITPKKRSISPLPIDAESENSSLSVDSGRIPPTSLNLKKIPKVEPGRESLTLPLIPIPDSIPSIVGDIRTIPFSPRWSVSLEGGPLMVSRSFRSGSPEYWDLKSNHETILTGYQLSGKIHRSLGRRFQLGIGINYQAIRERVDYAGILAQTTTPIPSDSANFFVYQGKTFFAPGNLDRTETTYLRLRHYNYIHQINIPLEVRYRIWEAAPFSLQLGTGVNINVLSLATGKFINPENTIERIQNSNGLFKSGGIHGWFGGIWGEYALTSKIHLSFSGRYESQLQSPYRTSVPMEVRYSFWNTNLGLIYQF